MVGADEVRPDFLLQGEEYLLNLKSKSFLRLSKFYKTYNFLAKSQVLLKLYILSTKIKNSGIKLPTTIVCVTIKSKNINYNKYNI